MIYCAPRARYLRMKAESAKVPDYTWRLASRALVLGREEVHVWRADLDQLSSEADNHRLNLAADEQARADRFYFQKDRDHFIVARGVLRAILGIYLNRTPQSLAFDYNSHGKPALALPTHDDDIRFNISHSHGVALYAVTRGRELGIDVERIRRDLEVAEIAGRFFSRREVAVLRALPTDSQRTAFFLGWTRKEAYIKARGDGLSIPLDQFDVSLTPGEPAPLLSTRPDSSEAARWSLYNLVVSPDFAAALAVEGQGCALSFWQWPEPAGK